VGIGLPIPKEKGNHPNGVEKAMKNYGWTKTIRGCDQAILPQCEKKQRNRSGPGETMDGAKKGRAGNHHAGRGFQVPVPLDQ
jgi:hypothetical protein